MTKKDRLLDVFERLRYEKVLSTKKEFAECIGFDKTNLSSAFNGSEKYLTDNLFNKVADTFPQFDRVWLLTGEGPMLNTEPKISSSDKESINLNPNDMTIELVKMINRKDQEIKNLNNEIANLREEIGSLRTKIQSMTFVESESQKKGVV